MKTQFNYESELERVNIDEIKSFLEGLNELDVVVLDIKKKLAACHEIEFHRKIAEKQREMYNKMRFDADLLKNELLIEIDFKQKSIVIGQGPRQLNPHYYKQTVTALIGFGVYFTNENSQI
jgi:hypothetical protein